MRFWFEHSSEVSLREQVVAQVTLGILSGELAAGERLPSIRELARRFNLHANTVSAGYRQLEAEGWVAPRKGSGVYVRANRPEQPKKSGGHPAILDRLIANLYETAARLKIPDAEIAERVRAYSTRSVAGRILVVEPDPELRRIVMAELAEAVDVPVGGCGFGECGPLLAGASVVTLPSKLDRVRAEAPGIRVHSLKVRAIPTSFAEHLPPAESRAGIMVGIASRWPEFLRFGRTMLVAAGFSPDALMVRDAAEAGWKQGLEEAAAVVCDLVTAQELAGVKVIVTRLLADGVGQELREGRLAESA